MLHTIESTHSFELERTIDALMRQVPAQDPLKDFIQHNTLHALQDLPFREGIRVASKKFGCSVLLTLKEYWLAHSSGRAQLANLLIDHHKGLV